MSGSFFELVPLLRALSEAKAIVRFTGLAQAPPKKRKAGLCFREWVVVLSS